MMRWFGSDPALERRLVAAEEEAAKARAALAALEGDVVTVRAAVAARTAREFAEAEHAAYVTRTLGEVSARLLVLETAARMDAETLRAVSAVTATLEQDAAGAAERRVSREADRDADRLEIVKLRTALTRLERQLELDTNEARTSTAALLARIGPPRVDDVHPGRPAEI